MKRRRKNARRLGIRQNFGGVTTKKGVDSVPKFFRMIVTRGDEITIIIVFRNCYHFGNNSSLDEKFFFIFWRLILTIDAFKTGSFRFLSFNFRCYKRFGGIGSTNDSIKRGMLIKEAERTE